MLKLLLTICLVICLWLPSKGALAWNGSGHMVTGAIAFKELQNNDPNALTESIRILKTIPTYDDLWKSQIEGLTPSDPSVEQVFLMLAARWPDDIRKKKFNGVNYDKPTWHYVNFPYRPPGQPDSVELPTPDPSATNILTAIAENLEVLGSPAPDADRAVALCWLAHLVGDIHQPLHTTTLFTEAYPDGDRGGNRFHILAPQSSRVTNLHSFWDGLILNNKKLRAVNNRAVALRNDPNFSRDKLSELETTNFQDWAKPESFEIAKKSAYLEGSLAGSPDENDAPVLPSSYPKNAQAIAERRAVLAGYRLADLISNAL